jgi:hypothetical protein
MTKREFLSKVINCGIDIEEFGVTLNNITDFSSTFFKVIDKLKEWGYIDEYITKNVILAEKTDIYLFLKHNYDFEISELEDTWNYLLSDMHVLFEFKYFAINNKFIPIESAYEIEGYTAQSLFEEKKLSLIDSFEYLIYLRVNREFALEELNNKP